ncbi:MAG: hypothetical protein NZ740_03815 [Kiritimatiellae bacterium]|nr:hypothetical protein [Kiritimatiellia bacterium]MDW8458216.1 hypothetical protein [Verrucomicrobiota bacterium]
MRKRRNFRKRARGARAPRLLLTAVFLAIGLGFLWLWIHTQCERLSQQIRALEQEKTALRRRIVNEEFRWSSLTTYENMMKLLKEHGIEMNWPTERQIVRVRRAASSEDGSALARN